MKLEVIRVFCEYCRIPGGTHDECRIAVLDYPQENDPLFCTIMSVTIQGEPLDLTGFNIYLENGFISFIDDLNDQSFNFQTGRDLIRYEARASPEQRKLGQWSVFKRHASVPDL